MKVKFWGTRGSLVCPGPDTVRYGGNTVCVEVCHGDTQLILDAGIGIVPLGESLVNGRDKERASQFDILLSHFHWDHVLGFPFFAPIYLPGRVRLYGPDKDALEETVHRLFHSAYSPIKGAHNLAADLEYHEIPRQGLKIGDAGVTTTPLCHPELAPHTTTIAFRIELGGKVLVYATDHEAGVKPELDTGLIELAKDADVLIHDAYFTPEEYSARPGWGHSTFEQAVSIASRAGVKHLVLFHYEPDHDDEQMDRMLERAREAAPESLSVHAALDKIVMEI